MSELLSPTAQNTTDSLPALTIPLTYDMIPDFIIPYIVITADLSSASFTVLFPSNPSKSLLLEDFASFVLILDDALLSNSYDVGISLLVNYVLKSLVLDDCRL